MLLFCLSTLPKGPFWLCGGKRKRISGKSEMSSRAEGLSKSPRWLSVPQSWQLLSHMHVVLTYKHKCLCDPADSPVFTPHVWMLPDVWKRRSVAPPTSHPLLPPPSFTLSTCVTQKDCCLLHVRADNQRRDGRLFYSVSGLIPHGDHVHHRVHVLLFWQCTPAASVVLKRGAALIDTWIKGL